MNDTVRYPAVYPSEAGPYSVIRARYARENQGRRHYREDCEYGTPLVTGLALPTWLYAELGKPRTLTIVIGAGPWIGRTADLFGKADA